MSKKEMTVLLLYAEATSKIEYDPITGAITWKSLIDPTGDPITAEDFRVRRANAQWNGKYGGKKAGSLAKGRPGKPYNVISFYGKAFRAHKLAVFLYKGYWPEILEFKDYDRTNLKWDNLVVGGELLYPTDYDAFFPTNPPTNVVPFPPPAVPNPPQA